MTAEHQPHVTKATPTLGRRITTVGAGLFAVALAIALVSAFGTPAHADMVYNQKISRGEVLARAYHWYFDNVPYSQTAYYPDPQGHDYRTDCSGFISMAWHLDQSRTTSTLDDVSTAISKSSLKPGDILLRVGYHAVLFEKWTDSAKTRANLIAQANTADDMEHYADVPISNYSAYTAYRYTKIFDDTYDGPDTSPTSTTGATCRVDQPDDPTIDLRDRRDVYIEVRTCIRKDYVTTNVYRFTGWITLSWAPGKDGDDSSDMTKKRFDGFFVHTQLQHHNVTTKEVYCYLADNINASYTGSRSCNISYTASDDGYWSADGFLNWDEDNDGKYWQKPWYPIGPPNI